MITFPEQDILKYIIEKYDLNISPEEENALKYIHWEWKDYSEHSRIMWPLAGFCHMLDIASARIFFSKK
jgi:hypothetical protein